MRRAGETRADLLVLGTHGLADQGIHPGPGTLAIACVRHAP